jgi:hypothetical protein
LHPPALASPPLLLELLPPLELLLDPLLELEAPPLELLLELLLLELEPLNPPELLLPEPDPLPLPEPLEPPPSDVVAGVFEHAAAITIGNPSANEVKLYLCIG